MADDDGAASTLGRWGSLISGAAGVKNLTNIAKNVADSDLTPGQQEAADSAERRKRTTPNVAPSKDYDPDPSRKDRPSKSYGVGEGDQQSNDKPALDYIRHFAQPDILAVGHNPGMKGTMEEFKAGKLHSGSKAGPVVKNRKQAIAIGLSQQRRGK